MSRRYSKGCLRATDILKTNTIETMLAIVMLKMSEIEAKGLYNDSLLELNHAIHEASDKKDLTAFLELEKRLDKLAERHL